MEVSQGPNWGCSADYWAVMLQSCNESVLRKNAERWSIEKKQRWVQADSEHKRDDKSDCDSDNVAGVDQHDLQDDVSQETFSTREIVKLYKYSPARNSLLQHEIIKREKKQMSLYEATCTPTPNLKMLMDVLFNNSTNVNAKWKELSYVWNTRHETRTKTIG
jgi:hypothetical protein